MTATTIGNGTTLTGNVLGGTDDLVIGAGARTESLLLGGASTAEVTAGTASGTLVAGNATFTVGTPGSFANAYNTTVNGGRLVVNSGGSVNRVTVNGGRVVLRANGFLNDVIFAPGSTGAVDLPDLVPVPGNSAFITRTGEFDIYGPPVDGSRTVPLLAHFTVSYAAGTALAVDGDGTGGTLVHFVPVVPTVTATLPTVTGGTAAAPSGSNNVVRLDTGTVSTAAGSAGNTVLAGTGPVLVSANGSDTVFGGGGSLGVTIGTAATVVGGAGAATVFGGTGASTVFAGTGTLTYVGGTGADLVVGTGLRGQVQGGTGGGTYFGSGSGVIVAGAGKQAVLVGNSNDRLYSAGAAGDLFGVAPGAQNVTMSGLSSTGNDVFFGAAGTGDMTFLAGSGDDIMAVGRGNNTVSLGAGHSTVFGNAASALTQISFGAGSADIALAGQFTNLFLNLTAVDRTISLFNFDPAHARLFINVPGVAEAALAGQANVGGSAVLHLQDRTTLVFVGVPRIDAASIV